MEQIRQMEEERVKKEEEDRKQVKTQRFTTSIVVCHCYTGKISACEIFHMNSRVYLTWNVPYTEINSHELHGHFSREVAMKFTWNFSCKIYMNYFTWIHLFTSINVKIFCLCTRGNLSWCSEISGSDIRDNYYQKLIHVYVVKITATNIVLGIYSRKNYDFVFMCLSMVYVAVQCTGTLSCTMYPYFIAGNTGVGCYAYPGWAPSQL